MLHPYTELRFVSDEIGYGIFATEFIPKGTITWVKDELDRVFTPQELEKLNPATLEHLLKYTYRNSKGEYLFCWDLTRYVNHSFEPNSMLTSMGFEIAIKDIPRGTEITNDYGTLNIIEPFQCANDPDHERQFVCPDDLLRLNKKWDQLIESAFTHISSVGQPLFKFLTSDQSSVIDQINRGETTIPSVIKNLFKDSK